MPEFAFLLHHAPDRYSSLSEDEAMTIFKDYMQWMQKASDEGVCSGGYKLAQGPGRLVTSTKDGVEVHDSPFAELSEILGGLMTVKAADYDSAVEIAMSHPHLVHNRCIEIRQIDGND
ncbi:MAG: YciI family protein [Planctomycetota bacterium]|nr:YciI family protein [Planctomycetota bacterium]